MLVAVDKVIVGRVVQEDEPEADGEPADGRADPMYVWVRRPGEDEQPHRDEPARAHHWDETVFGRGLAVEARRDLEVVLVDEWGEEGRGDDAQSERDLREIDGVQRPAFLQTNPNAGFLDWGQNLQTSSPYYPRSSLYLPGK